MSLSCKQARNTDFSSVVFMGRTFSFLGKKKKKERKVSFQESHLFRIASAFLHFFLFGSDKRTSPRWKRWQELMSEKTVLIQKPSAPCYNAKTNCK